MATSTISGIGYVRLTLVTIIAAATVLVAGCNDGNKAKAGPPAITHGTLPPLSKAQVFDQDGALQAKIRWTTDGVPHITADTVEELGFGQGYAQARDNICIIADEVLKARSERAKFYGPGPGDINVITDFSYKALGVFPKAQAGFANLSLQTQAILNGFAAGYNQYLGDTGVNKLTDQRCAGQPWVRPITAQEIYAYYRIVAMIASGDQFATGVTFLATPPSTNPAPVVASAHSPVAAKHMLASLHRSLDARTPTGFDLDANRIGSNGWGIGGDLSESGRGALLANPHFPYTGPERFWQSQNIIPGVLDVNGAGLIGYPTPQIGFNQHLAWTHTVSAANRFTVYLLQLKAGDNMSYMKDGEAYPITSQTVQIEVANGSGGTVTLEKTFYYSEYGPMMAANAINPAFPAWGDGFNGGPVAFTYRDAAAETAINFIDQWLGMGRAQDIEQFKSVFADCGTTYWVNTMYADDAGNAMYIDGSAVPALSPEAIQAFQARISASPLLAAAYQQGLPVLDGSTSRDDWVEGRCGYGAVPFDEAPTLVRSDFVQSSNDSYWATNPAAFLTGFSPLYGPVQEQQGLRTRIGLYMLRNPTDPGASNVAPAGTDGLFSARDLINMLYSERTFYGELGGVREALQQRCNAVGNNPVNLPSGGSRSVQAGCTALDGWDGLVNLDSTGAVTFRLFIAHYYPSLPADFSVPFDPADPVNTPRDPKAPSANLADDLMLQALAESLEQLDAVGLAYDAALGDVQVVQQSAGVPPGGTAMPQGAPIPWRGGDGGREGAFSATYAVTSPVDYLTRYPHMAPADTFPNSGRLSTTPGEGYLIGSGTSWHFGLMFTDDGPVAYGLLSYSQSSNPASPHFRDQAIRYSNKNYRKLLYTEAAIAADPNLTTQTITNQ